MLKSVLMTRRIERNKEPVPPEGNLTPLWTEPDGTVVRVNVLYGIFKQYQDNPTLQARYARAAIQHHGVLPGLVIPWVNSDIVQFSLKQFCEVIKKKDSDAPFSIPTEQETQARAATAKRLLADDETLIHSLGPYISQLNLARTLVALKYRNLDNETSNVLVSL